MDKCSCGEVEYDNEYGWIGCVEGEIYHVNFCPDCGDQLLPDGRVIPRESVPNKLMTMLREVQENCPESGLQEFALKCFNWIEEMRDAAGVYKYVLAFTAGDSSLIDRLINEPENITLGELFRLLNAAQKAQEAK